MPDAFDLRPDTPDCSCFPDDFACHRCCDRSLGHRGDPRCWGDERRLEGVWTYHENPEARFKGSNHWNLPHESQRSQTPGVFELCCGVDPLRHARGVAVYRTHLPRGPGILSFGACALRCVVVVDGQAGVVPSKELRNGEVLEDHAGLSPFDVEAASDEEQELLVMVDNCFRERLG